MKNETDLAIGGDPGVPSEILNYSSIYSAKKQERANIQHYHPTAGRIDHSHQFISPKSAVPHATGTRVPAAQPHGSPNLKK